MAAECFEITFYPLAAGIQLFRAIEHTDGTMTGLQQVLHGLNGSCFHVTGDIVDIGEVGYAIEEYYGDAVALEHVEMFVVGGVLGDGDDEAVDAVAHDILHNMFLSGFDVMGLAEQYGVFVFAGGIFNGADGGGKIELGEVGEDDADGESFALLEEDRLLVGFIVHFPGQLLDPDPGEHADPFMVMKGAGYGRCRDIEFFGNFLDRGWIDHKGIFKRNSYNIIHITSYKFIDLTRFKKIFFIIGVLSYEFVI